MKTAKTQSFVSLRLSNFSVNEKAASSIESVFLYCEQASLSSEIHLLPASLVSDAVVEHSILPALVRTFSDSDRDCSLDTISGFYCHDS